ncbi:MAG: CoA transferase [Chloroflexi bacterium]|nr:CoA transferase [Chloroflexota bacterium]
MPLRGVTILDMAKRLPGAICTLLLADMGAEVIKIEDPREGDGFRGQPPPLVRDESALFLAINRNKKSLKIDLKKDEGKEVFFKLVKQADVVFESFKPGTMDRLGLSYEVLREHNPALIYCAISGYGQEGPYRDRPGHDINYIARGGVLALTGIEGKPVIPGVQVADLGAGSFMAALGIVSALYGRKQTGQGRFVDISLHDGVVFWAMQHILESGITGGAPVRGDLFLGGRWACYNVYETKDGKYVTVGSLEPKFWQNFCRALGREDFVPYQFKVGEKQAEMKAALRETFRTRTRDEWTAFFKDVDTCVEPMLEMPEILSDPHLLYRKTIFDFDHPTEGRIKQVASPISLSDDRAEVRTPPPAWGEHNREILGRLGYSGEEIERLEAHGVV